MLNNKNNVVVSLPIPRAFNVQYDAEHNEFVCNDPRLSDKKKAKAVHAYADIRKDLREAYIPGRAPKGMFSIEARAHLV